MTDPKDNRPDQEGHVDRRTIRIDGDVEKVWAAWAEPEHVKRWFSDDARGTLEPGEELVHTFEGHGEHRYTVIEVEAPHRLVLEGQMMEGEAFRQEVRITREEGTTILELVHSGFGPIDPDDETAQGIDSGWTMALTVLKHYVEHYFGRDKTTVAIFRPARFDYGALAEGYYFTGEGRLAWLGGIADELEGELVRTDHEVCFRLPGHEGVLELKAFGSSPDQRFLGLRAIAWREGAEEPLQGPLTKAVGRLVEAFR